MFIADLLLQIAGKHPVLCSAKFRRHLHNAMSESALENNEMKKRWAEELHPSSRWRAKTRQGQVSTFYFMLLTNCSLAFNDHHYYIRFNSLCTLCITSTKQKTKDNKQYVFNKWYIPWEHQHKQMTISISHLVFI